MILTEATPLDAANLPVAELRAHLRLGTGFADDTLQDPVLERALRAALSQVEGATGKALVTREFHLSLPAWRDLSRVTLPRAPMARATAFAIVDADGERAEVSAARYYAVPDAHRPAIVSRGFTLPQIPVGGRAEIGFLAGYAAEWSGVPADLGLAVLSLAAARYEDRLVGTSIPPGIAEILAQYRQPRFGRFL